VYQDARLIASASAKGEPGPTSASIEVGNYVGTGKWTGPLKYVEVYPTALTSGQIQTHYRAGLDGWLYFDAALRASPRPAYVWRDGLSANSRDPVYPPRSPSFSLEAWLKARNINNRIVIYLPDAWYLQTDVLGRWHAGLFVEGRQFHATSAIKPPTQP
jgi:hypothetical protein